MGVAAGELLLVSAFHRGLDRGLQHLFNAVDEVGEPRALTVIGQRDRDLGPTALGMGRGDDRRLAAKPLGHVGRIDTGRLGEVGAEAFLDELASERRRTRAGARIGDLDGEAKARRAAGALRFETGRIGAPGEMAAGQGRAAHEQIEADREVRLMAQVTVRSEEFLNDAAH